MTWYYPGSKNVPPSQVASLWSDAGAPGPVANAFANGIVPAEGGYNSGAVLNTAYPNLPNYAGPPAPGNLPEYSVGLYGINLYPQYGPNNPQQAYQAGAALAANPKAQTVAAAQLFNHRGFEPWQGDAYVQGQGGPTAALARLGYASPPKVPVGTTGSLAGLAQTPPAVPSSAASTSTILGPCAGCLVPIPVAGGCMFTRCNAKALVGGVLVLAGGITMVVGIAVLARNIAPKVALSALRQGRSPVSARPQSEPEEEEDYSDFLAGYQQGQRDQRGVMGGSKGAQYVPTPDDLDWSEAA